MKRRRFLRNATAFTAGAFFIPGIASAKHNSILKGEISPSADLWRMSAMELSKLIYRRKVSVREVAEAHIERIKAVNPYLNAVTVLLEEKALKNAVKADEYLAAKNETAAFFGVPFSVKENVDLAGCATTEGVNLLKDNIVSTDSPHVHLLKMTGAIPLARTNMPDFGLRYHTENDLFGATINPWNALLTPGGSSGGDAVAVATGMVPLGLGNDYGGSIRWPAQCCGVSGLRPSRGRIPFYTQSMSQGKIAPSLKMMAVQGPIARRIEDLRTALEIMSANGSSDPSWVPVPLEYKTKKSFRIAVITNPGGLGVDDSVSEGVKKAAAILEKNGAKIEEIDSSSLKESAQLWIEMISTDIRNMHLSAINQYASEPAKLFINELLSLQADPTLLNYVNYLARINGISQSWQDFFMNFDAVIGPVCSRNPFITGTDIKGQGAARSLIEAQALTVTVNLLGLPSVALPVAVTNGIPQAVQIIGPLYSEIRCLDLAQIIENEVRIFTPIDPIKKQN